MKAKFAGIFSVLLATTCCVGPLFLVAIGLASGAAIVGRYHWLFLIAGIAVLTWAWAKYLREKMVCDCEHKTMQGRRSGMFTLLIATVIVLGFGSLNISRYIFASTPASAQTQTQVANGLNHVVISVDGMSCVTCEIAVRYALKQVDGVKSAHASVATKSVTVDYDPAKTNTEHLVAAVNSTGYRASLPDKMNDSASMAKNKNTNDTKIGLASASGGENAAITTADQISLFKVSLQCPAAPQIGCGSASKPVLLELERDPAVEQAWLNRAGTLIAVVWKSRPNVQTQQGVASRLRNAGCCARDAAVNEVQGEARDQALKEFESGQGWYRSAEVDRLSEEEAGIIAARLVRRVGAKITLAENKAERLREVLAAALKKCFTEGQDQGRLQARQLTRDFLDEKQIAVLQQAIEKGVRPLPNES
jgi:copper chaperone CopZ